MRQSSALTTHHVAVRSLFDASILIFRELFILLWVFSFVISFQLYFFVSFQFYFVSFQFYFVASFLFCCAISLLLWAFYFVGSFQFYFIASSLFCCDFFLLLWQLRATEILSKRLLFEFVKKVKFIVKTGVAFAERNLPIRNLQNTELFIKTIVNNANQL